MNGQSELRGNSREQERMDEMQRVGKIGSGADKV